MTALPSLSDTPQHQPPTTISTPANNSSLDITQRIERKLAEYNASNNVFKRWLFEILSWLVSASCMTVIIILYTQLNNRPHANHGYLLILANIMGKVSSAALIVPTSEALGQLKWNWFHNSKAMWDFEIFDKASRGPLGALMLLYRTKGRSLAAMGALLILLLLAIDTFFQQVVILPDRWMRETSRGLLPRTTYYSTNEPMVHQEGSLFAVTDPEILVTMKRFALGNGTQPIPFGAGTRADISVSCPTSNCTWPVYNTLGVCSKCADISDLLKFACLKTEVDWTSNTPGGFMGKDLYPNATMCGYFLNVTSQSPTMMSGYIADAKYPANNQALLGRILPLNSLFAGGPPYGNGSVHFKEFRNKILDMFIVSAHNGSAAAVYQNNTPVAQECMLTWCVQTIDSRYSEGEYQEEVLKTVMNTTQGPWPFNTRLYGNQPIHNGTTMSYTEDVYIEPGALYRKHDLSRYGSTNLSMINFINGFAQFFPSFTTANNETDAPSTRDTVYAVGPAITLFLKMNPWLAPNNVTRHMDRMATALTNVIRSNKDKEMVEGDAWSRETYISIRWAWLTFPLLLLLLSLAFLVATIIKTSQNSGVAVWKTSTMPTLIYGLPKETQQQFESSEAWNRSQHTRKVRVRLSSTAGWRVSSVKPERSSLPSPTRESA